ncbi:MAG: 16S rRNA (cytosine(967)-C(5))-methyltransferase RsmB [Betaproteobacteria bacterium]|nr:MAG: 16S rRNA (cytosine(967)-C(5))-methyltransferase RsmB [Betaproteobacteria bacterium]
MTSNVALNPSDTASPNQLSKRAKKSPLSTGVLTDSAPLALVQRRAAEALLAVLAGNNADTAIARVDTSQFDGASRSALADLVLGTLRFFGETRGIVRQFVRAKPEPLIEAILWVAVYQLAHSKTASHVVVSQAVAAVEAVNRGAKGFANAVLRNYQRAPEAALAKARDTDEGEWNHPAWWVKRVRADHPEWWELILRGGNAQGPLTLRINPRKTTQEKLVAAFKRKEIELDVLSDATVVMKRARSVQRLPGFAEGWFSVQDAGAQLAAPLLGAKTGMRVLDACAAPGGKAAHILELSDCSLVALDIDVLRNQRVSENFSRLGLTAEIRAADASQIKEWWDGKPFDRILLDAPCTGSGVVRRHPDGKWLKRETDMAQLANLQALLIDRLWQTLAVGGRMLYCTCSVFKQENAAQIDAALLCHANMRRIRINLPGDPASSGGQLLPGGNKKTHNHDGYFYALLEKIAS